MQLEEYRYLWGFTEGLLFLAQEINRELRTAVIFLNLTQASCRYGDVAYIELWRSQ